VETDFGNERKAFHEARRRVLLARDGGDDGAARQALDEAMSLADAMSFDEDVQLELAHLLWEFGRLAEAALYLEHLAARSADEARLEREVRLAAAYLRLGRLEEAVALLKGAIERGGSGAAHLQLGSALRYRGRLEEARPRLQRAFAVAKSAGDGALAIASLAALGELELDADNPKEAVVLFGRALGLTEMSRDESLTVLPLAGLAQAHHAWGYPAKGREVAEKALRRARAHKDRLGTARALLSLGLVKREEALLAQALAEADAAPHLPLAVKAFVALAQVAPGSVKVAEGIKLARKLEMDLDVHRLEALR
jgi:tetratricopeptide (TPR) repeat protein